MSTSTPTRFDSASIALHWITLLLLIGVYACIELREFWPKGSVTRDALKSWHFTLGLTVWILTWLRLAVRAGRPNPAIVPPPPAWQQTLSRSVHVALYGLLIAMPIGGWLILSAEGKAIPFWFIELPPIAAKSTWLAETVEEIHETLGKAGYLLIGLHAAAALYHHYVMRDTTLSRMMPGKVSTTA